MPARIRHSPLAAGLSLVDLPILPFLAPRLLRPWPRHLRGRRSQSTAAAPLDCPAAQVFANDDRLPNRCPAARQMHQGLASDRYTQAQDTHVHLSDERLGARKSRFEHLHDTRKLDKPPTQHLAGNVDSDSLRGRTTTDSTTLDNHPPLFGQTESRHNHLNLPAATAQNCMRPTQEVSRASKEGSVSSSAVAHSPKNDGYEELYFCAELYLQPLHDFLKADRRAKGLENGRYFGFWWERWFEGRRRDRHTQLRHFTSEKNRRLVMQRVEAIANFDPEADLGSLRIEWMEIPKKIRRQHWPGLILDTLAKEPEHALKFLLATCESWLPHKNFVSDVFDYLIDYHLYRRNDSPIPPEDFAVLFDIIYGMLQRFGRCDISISEYAIYHLSRHADRAQTQQLYTSLVARETKLSLKCKLHFVDNLARRGATDTAVEVVKALRRGVVDFTLPQVESVCATLLRCSHRDPEAKVTESEIFSLLLEYGLVPRINFYNILALNAIESGDHETAWKIYDMVIENGIEPSNYTYSILLNDAKGRLDHGAMEHIVGEIKSRRVRNEYIATDVLHAMWRMHEQQIKQIDTAQQGMAWRSLWKRMLSVYSTYFETGPLEDLAPELFAFAPQTAADAESGCKMHPDYPTLVLMVVAALRCAARQWELPHLYDRYRRLVVEGHPDFVKVAREIHVPEAFIGAIGQSPRTLALCTRVLTDMLGTQPSTNKPERVRV